MDPATRRSKESPKKSARFFTKLLFLWLIKLIYKGTKRGLKVSDLYRVMPSDESAVLADRLERNWSLEVERTAKPSLLRALRDTFLWSFTCYGFLLFVQYVFLRPFQPVVLALFIQLFIDANVDGEPRTAEMYLYGAVLVLLTGVVIFFNHHVNLELCRIGMRARVACCSVIYRKVLRLSKKSLGQTASGQIVNLLSNDVQRFDFVAPVLHFFWIMPIQAVIVTYFIWEQVHLSALAGVVAMILMTIPTQGYMGKIASVLRLKVAKRTDYRVKLMNEIISGVQVIKMYTWERPFERLVRLARKKEIRFLTMTSYLRGVYASFAVFTERTTLFFSVVCYYLLGNEITADRVFSMAQFFNILQLSMAIFFPMAVTMGAEALVSIRRLEDVLNLEEKTESSVERTEDRCVTFENVTASWTTDAAGLRNFSCEIPAGNLCAVVGPVGAGKSSLLQLILGELKTESGRVRVGGSVSYAAQEPWLFVASVRRNILFGRDYDKERYRKTVEVCALEKDFELFPDDDRTLVGERGVSLSGGQRARISLARAVYREADIYLLDDPLSAVDTHVAKHLFEECIVDHLKGKTRILVTHQLQFLKKVDRIIVLNEGRVEAVGTFEELSHSELDFTRLLGDAEDATEDDNTKAKARKRTFSGTSGKSNATQSENLEAYEDAEENEETVLSQGSSAYFSYIKSSGRWSILFGLLLLLVLGQVVTSVGDFWLTYWTTSEQNTPSQNDYSNMYVYVALISGCIVFTTIRSIVFFKLSMRASKNLHNNMFHALLKAPMRFFDTNPSGRILNRFSRDMGAIDEVLPRVSLDAIQILLVMTGILVMITIANYYMVIAAAVLGALFFKMRAWYIKAAKDIKHLEGITKSPLFSHLNASLRGILTIRATDSQVALKSEFDAHQNLHTSSWYLTIACVAAFGIWLDLICLVFVACVTFAFVLMSQYTEVNGSYVGLALSQGLILTGMLQFGMRQIAEVVSQMTCVERVLEYTQLPKEEENDTTAEVKPTTSCWPERGRIEFANLSLSYTDADPPVLKNLNFVILPGEKVGIVGRTGAGKSSMITALFRMAPLDGGVLIDDVDTRTLPLGDLRSKISIIPQEPVLFSATMRFNLDPFDEFEDDVLWGALKIVELKDSVPSLNFQIDEGGSNFSVGQRQLICLARAILRNNKILVLDEATANVDHRTDSLIQDTIRKKFASCTVLTIAHRLNTIIDSDKVLVMEAGCVIEFDHPFALLQNVDGHFRKMVEQTGPTMSARLIEAAERCFNEDDQEQ